MKYFEHTNAHSVEEASELLKSRNAKLLAGGTDLLHELKDETLPEYPNTIINIKTIPELSYIKESEEAWHIGATTKLKDIVANKELAKQEPLIVEAAESVASPLIRNQATIGGNICQDVRCWYYRSPDEMAGRLDCLRKNGSTCYAMLGDNRYHSVFGAIKANLSPCTSECPANVDIPGYINLLREGKIVEAANTLLSKNALPAITARVCTHFCQVGCNRRDYDDRVRVGNIERYVGDHIIDHPEIFYTQPEKLNGKRIAIVGSGPAGLSAAYYLRKEGFDVTVYEKMPEAGGLLMYAIPAYRLPKEVVQKLVNCLKKMGIKFLCNTSIGTDISIEQLQNDYNSVFISTGAWKKTVIGIDGEDLTRFGLEFLVEVKGWMEDKPGMNVVVIGGGNVAVDVAVTAKRLGAASVTMVSLESRDELPATKEEIDRAEEEGILLMPSWAPKNVLRTDGKITGIELKRCSSVRDASGRFSPQYDENECKTLTGDSILLAVGQRTDLSFLGEETSVEINRGRIAVVQNQQTTVSKVFAGGDAVTGPATVVSAIASGRRAADGIYEYLLAEPVKSAKPITGRFLKHDKTAPNHSQAVPSHIRPINELRVDLEDDLGLNLEEVITEANRCLNCGCIAVNASDLSTVLLCLDATIKTNKRIFTASEFFMPDNLLTPLLDEDELVTEIVIQKLPTGCVSHYNKFRDRKTYDFAIVGIASAYVLENNVVKNAKIALGAVAPTPIRATASEEYLIGKTITEEVAEEVAKLAVKDALPLEQNRYKIQVVRSMVKRSLINVNPLKEKKNE